MMFAEMLKAVDQLSDDELRQLRERIAEREQMTETELRPGTMNIDALLAAVDKIRDGMTQEEIEVMIAAMNEEYIEPFDESEWQE